MMKSKIGHFAKIILKKNDKPLDRNGVKIFADEMKFMIRNEDILFITTNGEEKDHLKIFSKDGKTYRQTATLKESMNSSEYFIQISKHTIINKSRIFATNNNFRTIYMRENQKFKVGDAYLNTVKQILKKIYVV